MAKKIEKPNKSDTDQIKQRAKEKPKPIKVTPNEGDFDVMVSTGSTLLDLAIAGGRVRGGGIPGGVLVEIYGPSQCVDCDTEFLSPDGWKRIADYDGSSYVMQYDTTTDIGCFVKPLKYIKQHSKTLYEFSARYVDQCLSWNHTVVYRYGARKKPILKIPFYEMKNRHEKTKNGFSGQFITSFNYGENKDIKYLTNIESSKLRVSVMSIADGYFQPRVCPKGHCVLNLKKQHKIERAKKLLTLAGIPFKEGPGGGPDYTRISYYDPYVTTKDYPKEYYRLPKNLLPIIMEEVVLWDGNGSNIFYSTNKNSADFIQFVFVSCNKHSSIGIDNREGKPICYIVRANSNKFVTMLNSKESKAVIKEIHTKDGFQYCFEVPTGCLVLRRNNKVFITGNSGKTALLAELCAYSQANGGNVKFLDPEGRLDREYSRIYGMRLDKENYYMPDTVNEVFEHILKWEPESVEGTANIVATDSLAALSSELEMGESGDKMGMKIAKDFSQGLRKTCRLIKRNNFIIACSNQVRSGTSGEITSGGKGIPFYASIRIRVGSPAKDKYLKKTKKINGVEHTKTLGIHSVCSIKKTVDDPYRAADIYIVFGFGVDDVRANLLYIKQMTGAKKFAFGDKEFGRVDTAIKYVEENDLEGKLKEQTIDLWEEIEAEFKTDRKPKKRGV